MDAPPMEVFRWAGFAIGFAIAYWVLFKPKTKRND